MVEQTQLGLLGNLNNTLANLSLPGRLGLLSTGVSLLEGQPLGQAVKTGLGTFGGLQQIDQQQRQREGIEALKKRFANNPRILALIDANPSGAISALTSQAFAPKTPVDTFVIVPQDELPEELKGQLVQKNTRTGKLTAIGKPTTNIGVNVGAGSKKFDEKIATELATDLKKLPGLLVDIEDLKLQRNRLDTIDASGVNHASMIGDQIGESAVKNNWAGIVVNGFVRDVEELRHLPIGIFAKGSVAQKTNKKNHGFEDVLISFGSVVMSSGKWIYIDQNGWLVADKKLEL